MARIMIVDDSSFMRTMLKRIVLEKGHIVVAEASDGSDVLELYKKHEPDIVTMDIIMQEVNGLEALKELRSFDKNAKVIMCSAIYQQKMVIEAFQYGAYDFIVKPFDNERVQESIEKTYRKF